MRKLISIAAILLTSLLLNHQAEASDIDKLLELPEKKIDIGIAALTFAREVYPDLDIKAYSAKLDKMVKEAKAFTEGSTDPNYRIAALNTYLYKTMKIQYDLTDIDAKKLENRYLNGILDTKKGSCISMPMLYLAIAQRLGYPVYPVTTPDHYFLRYVDSRLKKQNIEATSGGGYSPDKVLKKELEVSERGIKSGAYLRTLTYREYLANLLALNGAYWAEQGDFAKAIDYLEKATDINPKDTNNFENLGRLYLELSRHSDQTMSELHRIDADFNFMKADSLGFTMPSREKYENQVNKKLQAKNKKREKEASK